MSYDVNFKRKNKDEWIQLREKHCISGHMYCEGGTTEAWINITTNFYDHFEKAFGCDKGLKLLHNKPIQECVDLVAGAIKWMQKNRNGETLEPDEDAWKKTLGNAYQSLQKLYQLMQLVITEYPDYDDIVAYVGY